MNKSIKKLSDMFKEELQKNKEMKEKASRNNVDENELVNAYLDFFENKKNKIDAIVEQHQETTEKTDEVVEVKPENKNLKYLLEMLSEELIFTEKKAENIPEENTTENMSVTISNMFKNDKQKFQRPESLTEQNFVTFKDLSDHYSSFLQKLQQQLSSLGGGGEVKLRRLDDVDRSSIEDGKFLKYDGSSGKFVFDSVSGSGSSLTQFSVEVSETPSGSGSLSYNDSNGIFTFTQPDLSGYITSVSFEDVANTPTTLIGYGITDAATSAQGSLADSSLQPGDSANLISYDSTESDLISSNVQDAIDELEKKKINAVDSRSTLILYPTNNLSVDAAGYYDMVQSVDDVIYNDTPVNISTGSVDGANSLVLSLISDVDVLIGNPGNISMNIISEIRKTSGTGSANFFFEVYHRDSANTETLMGTSDNTDVVSSATYQQFHSSVVLTSPVSFTDTDRIVIKYYANEQGLGSCVFEIKFGGTSPFLANISSPVSNIPLFDASNIKQSLIPAEDVTYDLGSPTRAFRDLYLSGNTIYFGAKSVSIQTDVNGRAKLKLQDQEVVTKDTISEELEKYVNPQSGSGGLSDTNALRLGGELPSYYLDYTNIINKPNLDSYQQIADAFSGNYNDLSNRPNLSVYQLRSTAFSGDYNDLSNIPDLSVYQFSNTAIEVGDNISNLTNDAGYITANSVFSGDYNDLSNTPFIPSTLNELDDVTADNVVEGKVLVSTGTNTFIFSSVESVITEIRGGSY